MTKQTIKELIERSSIGDGLRRICDHGIDAELAHLDRELHPRRHRRRSAREILVSAIYKLAAYQLVDGFYVATDEGEIDGSPDFCHEHADQVARIHRLTTGKDAWVSSTSMGSDGHRECEFRGCGKHLNFGGLTDYGIQNALGLTEVDPRDVSCYPSELELAADALMPEDPRWELWEHHARVTIAYSRRCRTGTR